MPIWGRILIFQIGIRLPISSDVINGQYVINVGSKTFTFTDLNAANAWTSAQWQTALNG